MYKYIKRSSFQDIAHELQVDRNTVSDYAELAREAICDYMITTSDKLGGVNSDGSSKIIEIDESLFLNTNITAAVQVPDNGMSVE